MTRIEMKSTRNLDQEYTLPLIAEDKYGNVVRFFERDKHALLGEVLAGPKEGFRMMAMHRDIHNIWLSVKEESVDE